MRLIELNELFTLNNGVPSGNVEIILENHINAIQYKRPSYKYNSTKSGFIDKTKISENKIFPSETLFVSTNGEGSHTYTYVSTVPFVGNSDTTVLIPKIELSLNEKLYYAKVITNNRYKFSYGRKPKGVRLSSIKIPHPEDLPNWIYGVENVSYKEKSLSKLILIEDYSLDNIPPIICNNDLISKDIIKSLGANGSIKVDNKYIIFKDREERKLYCYQERKSLDIKDQILIAKKYLGKLNLDSQDWAYFEYQDIFDMKRGIENKKPTENGFIPFVSATEKNNGTLGFVKADKDLDIQAITIATVGSVGESFWQENNFLASSNMILLKGKYLNKYNALFIITLIKKEKYRFSYGRVWSMEKMKKSKILLPVDPNGEPDWKFMEDYIKTLPFSSAI